jgi:tetratricopeptide (TPR) repeat protein
LANEQIAKQKSPAILCLLGDIKKDVSYYYKAWEESGHKYARAMRSIGRQHFFTGEYKKSIESYETALAINRLYGDAWFTLGCAYMRIEDWKGAIYSFGVAVSIDEHNHDAWCNISSCYLKQGKEKEAILCIEQALKQNRKNWKIWENYIIFSLETKNFHKALTGARELIRSDKTDRVNATLVKKICDVFLRNYFAQECPPNEFIVHKKQLYLFFDEYTDKIAKDSQVYNIIGKVKNVLGEPMEVIKEYKLKEIRALMCIGWENEIDTCEKLENALNQLIAIYEGKPLPEEEKVFIKNTIISIEKCL